MAVGFGGENAGAGIGSLSPVSAVKEQGLHPGPRQMTGDGHAHDAPANDNHVVCHALFPASVTILRLCLAPIWANWA